MQKTNKMEIENYQNALVLRFIGEVDHCQTMSYKQKLVPLIDSHRFNYVIMDFSEVTFFDSAGIGFILGRYNQVNQYKGKVRICGVNEYADKIFKVSGVWSIIHRSASIEEAKKEAGVNIE